MNGGWELQIIATIITDCFDNASYSIIFDGSRMYKKCVQEIEKRMSLFTYLAVNA